MVRNLAKSLGFVVRKTQPVDEGLARRETCLVCHGSLVDSRFFDQNRVCPVCQFHYSMTARERIDSLVDPGTFRETNRNVTSIDPLSFSSRVSYKQRLFRDRRRTAQRCRILTDRQFMGDFCSQIHLPSGDPWLLHYIGNPLLAAYWALTKRLICW